MEDNQILNLGIIAITAIVGFVIGTVSSIIITAKENKALQEEVDKFRDLYFEEMDKWRTKYDNDDYEAYYTEWDFIILNVEEEFLLQKKIIYV